MINPKLASLFCVLMALASTYAVIIAVIGNEFPEAIAISGVALIFIWHAINSEMLIEKLTLKEFFSKHSVEHSKAKYLAIFGILCIPASFIVRALEWL